MPVAAYAGDSGKIDWGNLLGEGAGALAGYFGNSSATNAQKGGEQNAINTQTGVQGQLGSIYGSQRALGTGADSSLASQLGLAGTPNYAAFNNSPGFQFALGLGDQGIERAASANGSLYTPNTLAMLSQYNTGFASQNYNNYIGQLLQSAGLGAQGNAGLASGITQTGGNISQLQQNQGNAGASGALGAGGIASNLLGKVPWGTIGNYITGSGANTSGVVNGGNSLFGGGTGGSNYNTYDSSSGLGNFSNNSLFGNFANSSGYDPTTGSYSGSNLWGNDSFSNFSQNSGYDPTTGDYGSTGNWDF